MGRLGLYTTIAYRRSTKPTIRPPTTIAGTDRECVERGEVRLAFIKDAISNKSPAFFDWVVRLASADLTRSRDDLAICAVRQ